MNSLEEINESKINVKYLLQLIKSENSDEVLIDYILIESPYKEQFDFILSCCLTDSDIDNTDKILDFLYKNEEIKIIQGNYNFSLNLNNAYENYVNIDINKIIVNIENWKENLIIELSDNKKFDIKKVIIKKNNDLNRKFKIWRLAHAIKLAYDKCYENENILSYSHRKIGWSNPIIKINNNFSFQLRTNFGYGSVSYFFTKFIYKEIELTPFSEWINYRFALFSDIIRYSKKYECLNQEWKQALIDVQKAVNLSVNNELEFVKKYIISECELLVEGLEKISTESSFTFISENSSSKTLSNKVDITGRSLISFRSEKISGALLFLVKINEYSNIINIIKYINRIEQLNLKIKPIIEAELVIIKSEFTTLSSELKSLEPIYQKEKLDFEIYQKKKEKIRQQIIKEKEISDTIDVFKSVELMFNNNYPEYIKFKENYDYTLIQYQNLNNSISTLRRLHKSFSNNLKVIDNHFSNI
jgi:hypothetical protein